MRISSARKNVTTYSLAKLDEDTEIPLSYGVLGGALKDKVLTCSEPKLH
jgi:hypothetical protein